MTDDDVIAIFRRYHPSGKGTLMIAKLRENIFVRADEHGGITIKRQPRPAPAPRSVPVNPKGWVWKAYTAALDDARLAVDRVTQAGGGPSRWPLTST